MQFKKRKKPGWPHVAATSRYAIFYEDIEWVGWLIKEGGEEDLHGLYLIRNTKVT